MQNYKLEVASICHVGKIREKNQDNRIIDKQILEENPKGENKYSKTFITDKPVLFGIFDGMGGYYNGEKASSIVSKIASEKTFSKDNSSICLSLKEICMGANMAVVEESKRIKAKVGTTASMLCFNEDKVNVCNIGDSPIYCFFNSQLLPIFEEHTGKKIAERIFGEGNAPQKKYPLTQHIGIDPNEMIIVPYINTLEVRSDSLYLICSDGLTDMVTEERVEGILSYPLNVAEKVSMLFQEAMDEGGKDNISIILIQTKKIKNNFPVIIGIIGIVIVLVICIVFMLN